LTADPLAPESAFGSYFVYRKLLQDVPGFDERVAKYVATLKRKGPFLNELWKMKGGTNPYDIFSGTPTDAQITSFVKSRLMGRTTEGIPWPDWNNPTPSPKVDDFDYEGDRDGARCPFSAHVRKMKPRGCTGDPAKERERTIARRSVPCGQPETNFTSSGSNYGLLFICAQGSIERQFEPIQQEWANACEVDVGAFPTPTMDGLIGQDRHQKSGETINVDLDFYDLVQFIGGEYLFAPSIDGLRHLCAQEEGSAS
jgi:deferrochelatase/peroxidase EfeB